MTLSLCMIVKNEEESLEKALSCTLGFADEIIIVDTGSTDKTKEIALQFTDKVYDFEWIDDFSAARNFSFSKATGDYLMWLDADDIISDDDAEAINSLKKQLTSERCVVFMKYSVSETFSYYRERIIRNCPAAKWMDPVHEVIIPFGKIVYSDLEIKHDKKKENEPGRNLRIFEKQISNGGLSPRMQFYYARELMYGGRTVEALREFEEFLKTKECWVEDKISACCNAAECCNKLGKKEMAFEFLCLSFSYDAPRPEAACSLGTYLLEKKAYRAALFWYEIALKWKPQDVNISFFERDFNEFIPAIQLAVVYDCLGEKKRAKEYNNLAGTFKPHHSAFLSNKKYFDNVDTE